MVSANIGQKIFFGIIVLLAFYILYLSLKDLKKGLVNSISVYAKRPVSFRKEPTYAIILLIVQLTIAIVCIIGYILYLIYD